jgi:hypothetical protein
MPERSRERHELRQEQPDELATLLQVEIIEVDHRGRPELHEAPAENPRRLRCGRDVRAATGEHVIEPLAERREFALRIQHELLHATVRLLKQLPDRARLPAAAVRLDEHPRGDESIEVDYNTRLRLLVRQRRCVHLARRARRAIFQRCGANRTQE